MAHVSDVAAYILEKYSGKKRMTAMKLHKLLYYCQGWHLAWDEESLFSSPIEAWIGGPVVPDIYEHHRGRFYIDEFPIGNPSALKTNEMETIGFILMSYGDIEASELSDMTHAEPPWKKARRGLRKDQRGNVQITDESMYQFFSALYEEMHEDINDEARQMEQEWRDEMRREGYDELDYLT